MSSTSNLEAHFIHYSIFHCSRQQKAAICKNLLKLYILPSQALLFLCQNVPSIIPFGYKAFVTGRKKILLKR
jgi:hypothetical protein